MFKTFKSAVKMGVPLVLLAVFLGACAGRPPTRKSESVNLQERVAYSASIHHFERLIAEKPGEIEAVLGLARNLRWAGRISEAAQVLDQNTVRFGSDGRYLAELGKVRLVQGQSAEGVHLLQQATGKIRDDWRLYSALGIGLDTLEQYPQAEIAYNTALNMCPDDPAVINNLGISQGLSGHLDQGIMTLRRALSYGKHADKIKRNLHLFTDTRDLCTSCGADFLKNRGGLILAAGLKGTDQEGPCTPMPESVAVVPVMVERLAPESATPSIDIKVYFEFDSAILKPEALGVLDNLGQALTSGVLNDYRFELAGHTDAVGSDAYNQSLSERRAKAVRDYLVKAFQMDVRRMEVVGRGESLLLDPAHPDSDINRRVRVTRLGLMSERAAESGK